MTDDTEGKMFKVEHFDPVIRQRSGRFGYYGYDIARRLERTGKGRICPGEEIGGHPGNVKPVAPQGGDPGADPESPEERQRKRWEAWDRGDDDPGDGTLSPRSRWLLSKSGKVRFRE